MGAPVGYSLLHPFLPSQLVDVSADVGISIAHILGEVGARQSAAAAASASASAAAAPAEARVFDAPSGATGGPVVSVPIRRKPTAAPPPPPPAAPAADSSSDVGAQRAGSKRAREGEGEGCELGEDASSGAQKAARTLE